MARGRSTEPWLPDAFARGLPKAIREGEPSIPVTIVPSFVERLFRAARLERASGDPPADHRPLLHGVLQRLARLSGSPGRAEAMDRRLLPSPRLGESRTRWWSDYPDGRLLTLLRDPRGWYARRGRTSSTTAIWTGRSQSGAEGRTRSPPPSASRPTGSSSSPTSGWSRNPSRRCGRSPSGSKSVGRPRCWSRPSIDGRSPPTRASSFPPVGFARNPGSLADGARRGREGADRGNESCPGYDAVRAMADSAHPELHLNRARTGRPPRVPAAVARRARIFGRSRGWRAPRARRR